MATTHARAKRGTGRQTNRDDYVRHSREDALTERECVLLLQGARKIKDPEIAFQTRVAIMLAARLGLRAGEIAHFSTDWINWADGMIDIPEYDPCTLGQNGGICGDCRDRAQDRVDANNLTLEEARNEIVDEFGDDFANDQLTEMAEKRVRDINMTFREAAAERWEPKTQNSARSIPFDFNVRVEVCIERFAERYDRWPRSKATINRRINRAADHAGFEKRVYPHSLRASAASIHASRSVSAYALMSIMGWRDIQTARNYIRASDETAAKEIRSKYR